MLEKDQIKANEQLIEQEKAKLATAESISDKTIGSLNKIWPWKKILSTRLNSEGLEVPLLEKSILPNNFEGDSKIIWAIVFMIIGFLTILILERLGKGKENKSA